MAEGGEGEARAGRRPVPVAVLVGGAGEEEAVDAVRDPARAQATGAVAEGAAVRRRVEHRRRLAAPRGERERAGERVLAEERRRPTHELRLRDGLDRDEVEVHLLRVGLVDAHAVEEDADPLRDADDGREGEAPNVERRLP